MDSGKLATDHVMSAPSRLLTIVESSGYLEAVAWCLLGLCLLLGFLIVRKFMAVWQEQERKRGFYQELVRRYEDESTTQGE